MNIDRHRGVNAMPLKIVQNAYVSKDLKSTCAKFYKDFGIGPFVLAADLELHTHRYRGRSSETIYLDAAFAQSGDMNVEIIQVKSHGPSAIRDMFSGDDFGLHHVAVFCDDYVAERDRLVALGYPIASEFFLDDVEICFVDTRAGFGHMVELYPPHSVLYDLYARVRTIADGWDGKDLLIPW